MSLWGAGVSTSALGYGCSSLMARIGRAESVALLEAAFDAGITHYDVARLYGYGEAESALGQFLDGRRDRVTVTTKLGIEPPRRSRGLALAKAGARRAVAVAPALRRVARRRAEGMVHGGRFGVDEARASLETSLRELGTDYVDALLLHEATVDDVSDELIDFLEGCLAQGSVRAYGLATGPQETAAILAARPQAGRVVQVADSVIAPAALDPGQLGGRALITHSALAASLAGVQRHLDGSPERLARWSSAIGADCSDRAVLAELMLVWALEANPDGVVLFSSTAPARIAANARLGSTPPTGRVDVLAQLVRAELASA